MISNSAELELLFVTLRQQEAPVPVVVTLSKTNTEKKDTLWDKMLGF
jgi:hypothetical protein